jgi:hypothetical protein
MVSPRQQHAHIRISICGLHYTIWKLYPHNKTPLWLHKSINNQAAYVFVTVRWHAARGSPVLSSLENGGLSDKSWETIFGRLNLKNSPAIGGGRFHLPQ